MQATNAWSITPVISEISPKSAQSAILLSAACKTAVIDAAQILSAGGTRDRWSDREVNR
jgi:hypothetical protein